MNDLSSISFRFFLQFATRGGEESIAPRGLHVHSMHERRESDDRARARRRSGGGEIAKVT